MYLNRLNSDVKVMCFVESLSFMSCCDYTAVPPDCAFLPVHVGEAFLTLNIKRYYHYVKFTVNLG